MAEVKIEEIREMFRVMRESSNRALCFGEMQRELEREEEVERVALKIERLVHHANVEMDMYANGVMWSPRASPPWMHSGQHSPFFGW